METILLCVAIAVLTAGIIWMNVSLWNAIQRLDAKYAKRMADIERNLRKGAHYVE